MFEVEIDLAVQTKFLISFAMVVIGTAFFSGFGVKKIMQFLKSF